MICVPIKENQLKALIHVFQKAQQKADITELWLDELVEDMSSANLKKIFSLKTKPIIYKSYGQEAQIFKILEYPLDYIDLDINTTAQLIKKIKHTFPNIKLIISCHNFKSTPSLKDLKMLANRISRKGADVIKIATFAKELKDSFTIFSLLEYLKGNGKTAICLAMGKQGRLTRIAGHLFGNYLMYCPLKQNEKTANGQLTLKELCQLRSVL